MKISKETISILFLINSVIELYIEFFYKFDFKKVDVISNKRTEILDKIKTLTKRIPSDEVLVLTTMEQTIEIIIHMVVTRMALEY